MPGRQPLPRRVYWVRRLVVLGVPLLVVAIVVAFLTRGGGAEPEAGPTPTPPERTASAGPTPTPSQTRTGPAAPVPDCADSGLAVAVEATKDSFHAGEKPSFAVTLTNTGPTACVVDSDQVSRTAVVRSGDEVVWSEDPCVGKRQGSRPLLLAPGQDDTSTFTWPRVRSAEGCPSGLPAPKSGTYRLDYAVDGVAASRVVFTLG
ncbi:hypothetical protein [Cellulomonas massiliensis]|uniref:hypothetical protein n=1 Tax=Cellulomonas massiliensis TaxID=1465811 RepID=UPI0002E7B29A|nr:hypothetical protein [Cellulomonas massiliensis]